jgi:hypothetical protein
VAAFAAPASRAAASRPVRVFMLFARCPVRHDLFEAINVHVYIDKIQTNCVHEQLSTQEV